MTPRPSPVNAARPRMFTPPAPITSPSRASSPGLSWRITVRSVGIAVILAVILRSREGAPPAPERAAVPAVAGAGGGAARAVRRPRAHDRGRRAAARLVGAGD